ncbi:MAG: Mini-ribonuclease 3 [Faecousia sp.]
MNDLFHPEMTPVQVNAMSALALAHIGDAVFELLVRTKLCLSGGTTNGRLHHDTIARVCAPAQAALAERIAPLLTEEELAFYRRGKNSHTHAIPKNATPAQYAKATGLETLFGALWLLGRQARVEALFTAATEENYAL